MSDVKRIFVEKRDGFNVEAKQILWDLRHNLGVLPTDMMLPVFLMMNSAGQR